MPGPGGMLGSQPERLIMEEPQPCCSPRACLAVVFGALVLLSLLIAAIILVPWSTGGGLQGLFGSADDRNHKSSQAAAGLQTSRLRVTNGCGSEALWLARLGDGEMDLQNTKIWPLESVDVEIPEGGLATSRFWAKWRCVKGGNNCAIGDSGGPGQECDPQAGCAPPMDTKFEATFGATGSPCNTTLRQFAGCDFVDVSVKDGYTVPFELEIRGDCQGAAPKGTDKVHQIVECTKLSLDECPGAEHVGTDVLNLRATNPAWGNVAGCLSPCSKLTYPNWEGSSRSSRLAQGSITAKATPYCCPTPEACGGGELGQTEYVKAVHRMCPGVNSFAYDQGMGVGTCPAGTKYEMIFYCPPR